MLRCGKLAGHHHWPIVAPHGISLTVDRGEIVSVIGANGAGKSRTLKAIVGLVPPMKGRVSLEVDRSMASRRKR